MKTKALKIFSFILAMIMILCTLVSCGESIPGPTGAQGEKGEQGKQGPSGITPQLKVGEDNYWYISYDNGVTWANLNVKATGADGKDAQNTTATEDNQGLLFYPQDDGTYVVSGGNAKYMKNIVIPEKYRGGDVVAIEENAFKDFSVLETLVIPNSVNKIGQGIFAGCTSLTSISMPCYENTFNFMWLCTDASKNSISSDEDIFYPPR